MLSVDSDLPTLRPTDPETLAVRKANARESLHEDAHECRRQGFSVYEWLDRVRAEFPFLEALLGPRELEAIWRMTWFPL